jgi:hypothetical protein
MTLLAPGSQRVAPRNRFAVKGTRVLFLFLSVTPAARDSCEIFVVRKFLLFQVGVTVRARQARVHGCGVPLAVDEYPDGSAAALAFQRPVVMAGKTVLVALRRDTRGQKQYSRYKQRVQPYGHDPIAPGKTDQHANRAPLQTV